MGNHFVMEMWQYLGVEHRGFRRPLMDSVVHQMAPLILVDGKTLILARNLLFQLY